MCISLGLVSILYGASLISGSETVIATTQNATEPIPAAPQIPLTIEEELQQAINNTSGYGNRVVKLVPYSAELSYPPTPPTKPHKEAAYKERFQRFFETNEIYLVVKCTTNNKGYASEQSLSAVVPDSASHWVTREFGNMKGAICNNERATALNSIDLRLTIINQ